MAARPLDPTDIKILNLLQQNARLDIRQIADKVHKSPSPVHERIRKLQEHGYIKRYIAVLNRELLGRSTMMITLVKLNRHQTTGLRDFAQQMNTLPEVELCLHISGEFDFLLQVTLHSAAEYEEFLDQRLCALPIVEKVQSSLVLKECKVSTALNL